MSDGRLEFTGERFVPGTPGAIAYEHAHRYAFARRYARGKRVLDGACGEGYGSAQLAGIAQHVCGVDISEEAIAHARSVYGTVPNLRFEVGSVTALPLADASIDVVVSFETIEHLPRDEQPRMLAEFARVLSPDGLLVISSPNRRRYTDERDYHNPFHLHELYRDDLQALLLMHFPALQWFHQTPIMASSLWSEARSQEMEAWIGDGRSVDTAPVPDGMYYVVLAAKNGAALPASGPALSLFHDRDQSELARAEAAQAEVLRLDALLRERDASLTRQDEHVRHLEELVAYRERIVEERDAQLAAVRERHEQDVTALRRQLSEMQARLDGLTGELSIAATRLLEAQEETRRVDAALAAQERLIDYRQSLRWWVQLPWVRVHSWWHRMVGS